MSYDTVFELLPSSIYSKETNSANKKLWKLFSEQLNTIENSILAWYDKEILEGEALDKIGLLKGISRNGLNDIEYRYELSLPRSLEIVTLPSIYQVLSNFGTNPKVKELHSPYLFDIDRLDQNKTLDSSWNLFPATEPVVIHKLNNSWLLSAEEPLEAYNVRNLALLVQITTSESYEYWKMPKEIFKLLAGITVYFQFFVLVHLGLDFSTLEFLLDGSFLLNETRLLTTEIYAKFYSDLSELYNVPVIIEGTTICISPLKRNYTITKCEIIRSGEKIAEFSFQIQTSVYLQYQFIIT